jgi:hypothetical protein
MVWKKDEHAYTWSDLDGHVAECVLCAPRTGGDPTGSWPPVHARDWVFDAQREGKALDGLPHPPCRGDGSWASRCRDRAGGPSKCCINVSPHWFLFSHSNR